MLEGEKSLESVATANGLLVLCVAFGAELTRKGLLESLENASENIVTGLKHVHMVL